MPKVHPGFDYFPGGSAFVRCWIAKKLPATAVRGGGGSKISGRYPMLRYCRHMKVALSFIRVSAILQ